MTEIVCQWTSLPLAGRGEVSIAGKSYELRIGWLKWDEDERLEAALSYAGSRYRLQRDPVSKLWRCDCPGSLYRPWKQCKHSAAVAELLDQLIHYAREHDGD